MARQYKINTSCPHCGEEHFYWRVALTGEEQAALDNYYKNRKIKRQSAIANLIDDIAAKPVRITRQFRCRVCLQLFEATVTVFREDEVGFRRSDMIPMGVHPLGLTTSTLRKEKLSLKNICCYNGEEGL